MRITDIGRRRFLGHSLAAVAGLLPAARQGQKRPAPPGPATVALARCADYEPGSVRQAYLDAFDMLGGIHRLVAGRSVTVKVNLTGQDFRPFMKRPVGETYMTHFMTAHQLVRLALDAGARRVRIVESTGRAQPLEATLRQASWDVEALNGLGDVAYECTRNRGSFSSYAQIKVPSGLMFSFFEVNRAYVDCDVLISLAKLKQHGTTGVTLTMKNMFGMTPSSMYGGTPGDEQSVKGRQAIHDPRRYVDLVLPGIRPDFVSDQAGVRVPSATVDLCAARPVDIAIIDGITAINRGESRYSVGPLMRVTTPGVMIVGTNPVSVDAVGMAVMGFDPRAGHGTGAFAKSRSQNTLLLAEQKGLGTADLGRIDIRGLSVEGARHPYS